MLSVVYFGAAFAFLMAFAQLLKQWSQAKMLLAVALVSIGLMNLYFVAVAKLSILDYPHLLHSTTPMGYLTAPASYLYLRMISGDIKKLKQKHMLHFVPFLISLILVLSQYWILPAEDKKMIFEGLLQNEELEHNIIPYTPSIILAFSYVVYVLYKYKFFIAHGSRPLMTGGIMILIWIVGAVVGTFAVLAGNDLVYVQYLGVVYTASIVYLYLLSYIYPTFFFDIGRAVRKRNYEKSIEQSFNATSIRENLTVLMSDEKIYKQEELTLKMTADMLNISSHQLSHYINHEENTNFNHFINRYRVEEAMEQMRTHPDRKIISISYDVGFNTISVFNTSFRKHTGMTPTEYRARFNSGGLSSGLSKNKENTNR